MESANKKASGKKERKKKTETQTRERQVHRGQVPFFFLNQRVKSMTRINLILYIWDPWWNGHFSRKTSSKKNWLSKKEWDLKSLTKGKLEVRDPSPPRGIWGGRAWQWWPCGRDSWAEQERAGPHTSAHVETSNPALWAMKRAKMSGTHVCSFMDAGGISSYSV